MPLIDDVHVLGETTQGLLTARQLTAAGFRSADVSRAVSRGALVRVRRGVYALDHAAPMPRFVVTEAGVAPDYVRHVRAVLLSLGSSATAVGRTAAALRGWGLLVEPSRTVDVGVPHGRSRAAERNVRITQRRRVDRELYAAVADAAGLWVTTPVQTVLDCCLSLPRLEAVVVADSALRARAVSIAELRIAARRLSGREGAKRVRHVLAWLDPDSGSVLESVMRVRLLEAGLGGFGTQVVISDPSAGGELRIDFCFEDLRLVVEVDGTKWHQDVARDRERDNTLVCLGFRVLRYTWADVVHGPARVVREVATACAAWRPDFQYDLPDASRAA